MKTVLIVFFCIILAGSLGGMFYYIHAVLRHRDRVISAKKPGGDGENPEKIPARNRSAEAEEDSADADPRGSFR